MKNNLLEHLPTPLFEEIDVNPKRIYETGVEKEGNELVYHVTREHRFKDNFALNFALKKAKDEGLKFQIISDEEKIPIRTAILVTDFNPLKKVKFSGKIYEIDGHNIVPARYVSDKKEFNAFTFRKKIYRHIAEFLTELPQSEKFMPLEEFIKERLPYYAEFRNDPTKKVTSRLSPYLNRGEISSHRVAFEVLHSGVSDENKEAFLEELIVRKELADNFCLYAKDFKSFDDIPDWAKRTLAEHSKDFRQYIYSQKEFELAKTHDRLWNASQEQLLEEGSIHGYLRMYWAKKIMEWSSTPEEALQTAIYLNDKYGADAPSANGYVGILWSIGALHDRAFADRPVTGKIRPMTFNGAKSKFDVEKYISEYLK